MIWKTEKNNKTLRNINSIKIRIKTKKLEISPAQIDEIKNSILSS